MVKVNGISDMNGANCEIDSAKETREGIHVSSSMNMFTFSGRPIFIYCACFLHDFSFICQIYVGLEDA